MRIGLTKEGAENLDDVVTAVFEAIRLAEEARSAAEAEVARTAEKERRAAEAGRAHQEPLHDPAQNPARSAVTWIGRSAGDNRCRRIGVEPAMGWSVTPKNCSSE